MITQADKKALNQHLSRHHGFQVTQGINISFEQKKELHDLLHEDNYAIPPHEHVDGEMILTLGAEYLSEAISAIKGE